MRHVESSQQAKLREENELLRQQLQLQGQRKKEDTMDKDTTAEPQEKEGMQADLEELNRQLRERELQADIEIQSLKQQIQEKEAQMACMASWAMEALQCRQPAKSYGLYLRDQWLQFQINTLAQRGISQIQNPQQFVDLCNNNSSEDKAKLSEFYLHNLALPNITSWDPNTAVGDMQLMAMTSWLNHEEKRAVEVRSVMD